MASLQASSLTLSSHYPKVNGHLRSSVKAAIHIPKLSGGTVAKDLLKELQLRNVFAKPTLPLHKYFVDHNNHEATDSSDKVASNSAKAKLYVVLEAIADRVEMHKNIGEQRDNWNTLLLNSINMITLSASTIAGVAASTCGSRSSALALNLASTLLFSAATGMLIIMNKIQPSQLAEEQRNATKLFKELYCEIHTTLALYEPTELDVKDAMKKVLALDKAYPLPLLGKMIEKFPSEFKPATWWPKKSIVQTKNRTKLDREDNDNKWNRKLEEVMREVKHVIESKDSEEYMRLGNLALKVNKMLTISGPLLTGLAAASSAFAGNGALAIVAATAGTLATVVNTLEHGAQIGMVIEMYRNCGGFFNDMDESIDSMLKENSEKREDGEIFEMKVAMKLGRSLSELRDLAKKSSSSRMEGIAVQEFASQLF